MTATTPSEAAFEDTNHFVSGTPEILSPASVMSTQTMLIFSLSFAVLLIVLYAFAIRRRSSLRGNSVLIVGPSDAGKTAILSTLVYGQTLPTHTSMQTNTAVFSLPNQQTLLAVDVPGHPRIRAQFKEHLQDAKAVVFVVDSSTISRNGAAVAEHLHQVLDALMSLPPSQLNPAFAIVAHKCDHLKATASIPADQLAINRVRAILERELEKRKSSHAGGIGVESLGAEGEEGSSEMGGLDCIGGGEFKFAQWEGGEVTFLGTSVTVGKAALIIDEKQIGQDGLSPLREWLEELP